MKSTLLSAFFVAQIVVGAACASDSGGSIVKVDMWGKRRMTYIIRKQREGQYVFMHTKMPTTFNTELDRNLRYLESVMRHMIVVIE